MDGISGKELVSVEPSTPTPRRRRKKSLVWEYFTVEAVSEGCSRACCNQCKQSYAYSTGNKIAGTSHLKRHIFMGICPKIREEKQQLALTSGSTAGGSTNPPKRRYRSSPVFSYPFDQESSYTNLARMIIVHEYPLKMVCHPSFAAFVHGLQPKFKMPDVATIDSEVMAIYLKEKQNVMLLFGTMHGRVSLTIGIWTTSQSLGYVSLTGHFIDNDWKLHRRMLNFMMVSSPHSENALSDVIGCSLSDWDLKKKLFTITLDSNCSSHDIYSANLRGHLCNKDELMLKGKFFVVRCFAHVANIVAQDVIASIHGIVYNVRESVKYVKATTDREDGFAEIAEQLQIPNTKTLSLDVQMQWDATYLMLLSALDFKHAFSSLEMCDPNYNEAPSSDDWKKVEIVCTFLKVLYDSVNNITSTIDPTANIYFQEAWKIQQVLSHATLNQDSTFSEIAKEMHEKFDNYWKDCSLILAIAVIMDPRFKMKLVEFSFANLYGEDAAGYVKVIDDAIHELYSEYIAQPHPLTPASADQQGEFNNGVLNYVVDPNNEEASELSGRHHSREESKTEETKIVEPSDEKENMIDTNNDDIYSVEEMAVVEVTSNEQKDADNGNIRMPTTLCTGDGLQDFDIYISETTVTDQTKSELDQYLEESLVPRIPEFDILGWWKLNILKYPTLCKMARDVLAIQMCMVSPFSSDTGSKMLDEYRSSLQPDTVEALFCTKDWLQYVPTVTKMSSNAIVKMEM